MSAHVTLFDNRSEQMMHIVLGGFCIASTLCTIVSKYEPFWAVIGAASTGAQGVWFLYIAFVRFSFRAATICNRLTASLQTTTHSAR